MIISPGERYGCVRAPASKSQAHRLLILAAMGSGECEIDLSGGFSEDVDATARSLCALGADIVRTESGYAVSPITAVPTGICRLDCGESGATLRFLLPLCGALGAMAELNMSARLAERPLKELERALTAHGMTLCRRGGTLLCAGRLMPGDYELDGSISSQYISGFLLALPWLRGESRLRVTGEESSAGYIAMTETALSMAQVAFSKSERSYVIPPAKRAALGARVQIEGDWSGAAAFLCMGALSARGVSVEGLNIRSAQPDRAVLELLRRFGASVKERANGVTVRRGALRAVNIDAAPVPDLVPVLAALATAAQGETRIYNAARLRAKESDRLAATSRLINALGGSAREEESALVISGGVPLAGGRACAEHDHRMAMAAAVCALAATGSVELDDACCVGKSYPRFWRDFESLKEERA